MNRNIDISDYWVFTECFTHKQVLRLVPKSLTINFAEREEVRRMHDGAALNIQITPKITIPICVSETEEEIMHIIGRNYFDKQKILALKDEFDKKQNELKELQLQIQTLQEQINE